LFDTASPLRFLDKTGGTGSTFQLINGVFVLATFFGIRIVYGGMVVSGHPYVLPLVRLAGFAVVRVLLHVVPRPTSAAVVVPPRICSGQRHLAVPKLVLVRMLGCLAKSQFSQVTCPGLRKWLAVCEAGSKAAAENPRRWKDVKLTA
jgi:hypothetical protein